MSKFYFPEEDVVFFHVPKNAGQAIRHGVFDSNYQGPYFERTPHHWPIENRSFGFAREPMDRFISAIAYAGDGGRWSVQQMLQITGDPRVNGKGIGTGRTPESWLKHHLARQTDPLNGILEVTVLGRFESLQADFDAICDRFEIERRMIPRINVTEHRPRDWRTFLTREEAEMVIDFYRPDFEALDYPVPSL